MDLKNKFILKFSIGFSMGMLFCTIITSIMTTQHINDGTTYFCDPSFIKMFNNELVAFIVQSIISGLYGAICFGSTVIYEIEDWSILNTTLTHFFITIISFFVTAFTLKWWPSTDFITNAIFVIIIIIIYFIIWLVQYLIYKKEVKIIQSDIKKFRRKNTK